jgi:hypothetical protein
MQPQTTQSQPDLQALALTKAIRANESRGNYSASGDAGTSTGAYQFQPDTWKNYAQQVLGNPNAPMTPENQNAVTYGMVKTWKDQGMGPADILGTWNHGNTNWKDSIGVTTINGKQIPYNTPQYVKDGMETFKQIYPQVQQQFGNSDGTQGGIPVANADESGAVPQTNTGPSIGGFIGNVFKSAGNLATGVANAAMHPIDTAKNIENIAEGGFTKLLGKAPDESTQAFDNAVGYLKNRYGGSSISEVVSHIGNTLYTDPVGAALDLSTLLDGAGAAIGAAGKISDISKVAELSKASDYISTVNGLIKSSSPEAVALLKQPGTLTKIADSLSTISDKINPIVGATNVASSLINKVSDFVPRRILLSAAPQLKRTATVDQALDHVAFGSIDKNLAVSATTKQNYYEQILKSLDKSPTQVGPDFGEYLMSEIKQKYANLGKTDEQVMNALKRNAGNEGGLVDKLSEGTLTTPEAYKLKVALENNSYKVAIDNPSVKANKDLAAFTGSAIGDYLKEIAPDTVQLFDEYSKEINWYKALKHIKSSVANKGILTMRDLVAFGAGHVTGVGGPLGLIAEKVLTSKTVQMNAAKAANIGAKGVKAVTNAVVKAAPLGSKVVNLNEAATGSSGGK